MPSSSLNIVGTLRITNLTCWIISGSWVCIRNLLPHSPLQKPACIKFSSEFVTRPSTRCADPPTTVLAIKKTPIQLCLCGDSLGFYHHAHRVGPCQLQVGAHTKKTPLLSGCKTPVKPIELFSAISSGRAPCHSIYNDRLGTHLAPFITASH